MHSFLTKVIYLLWLLTLYNFGSLTRYLSVILSLYSKQKKKNDVNSLIFQLVYLCKYKGVVTDRLTLTIYKKSGEPWDMSLSNIVTIVINTYTSRGYHILSRSKTFRCDVHGGVYPSFSSFSSSSLFLAFKVIKAYFYIAFFLFLFSSLFSVPFIHGHRPTEKESKSAFILSFSSFSFFF
jgi:hypothetical protein